MLGAAVAIPRSSYLGDTGLDDDVSGEPAADAGQEIEVMGPAPGDYLFEDRRASARVLLLEKDSVIGVQWADRPLLVATERPPGRSTSIGAAGASSPRTRGSG